MKNAYAPEDAAKMAAFINRKASVIDVICGIATMALFALIVWLYMIFTPEQMSAECEYQRATMCE